MVFQRLAVALTPRRNTDGTPKVDARALHGWLAIATPFHIWIARIIRDYEFAEG